LRHYSHKRYGFALAGEGKQRVILDANHRIATNLFVRRLGLV
jgi:hypothetical protein